MKTRILAVLSMTVALVAGAQNQSLDQMQSTLKEMQKTITNLQQQIIELKKQQPSPPASQLRAHPPHSQLRARGLSLSRRP